MPQPSLEIIRSKIFSKETLMPQLSRWRFLSRKIVFTNGCFDIIHLGHIDYLTKAADEGDVLVVGLNSDTSVTGLKGNSRPINNQDQRAAILASFSFVNAVVIFDEATPYELISAIQPDVLIKGGDYKPENIVGFDIVKARKGLVKIVDFLPGYSTTITEEKILASKKS